ADRRGRQARDRELREPGQPADGREEADPRRRRVGTRLLPEVSEPPSRLPRCVVEHCELGRGQQALSLIAAGTTSAAVRWAGGSRSAAGTTQPSNNDPPSRLQWSPSPTRVTARSGDRTR